MLRAIRPMGPVTPRSAYIVVDYIFVYCYIAAAASWTFCSNSFLKPSTTFGHLERKSSKALVVIENIKLIS